MTMSTVSSALSARRAVAAPVAARAPVVAAPAQRGSLVVVAASKKKDVRLTVTLECFKSRSLDNRNIITREFVLT